MHSKFLIIFLWFLFIGGEIRAEPQVLYFYQRGYVAGGEGTPTRLTDSALAGFARRNPSIKVKIVGLPWSREGDLKLRAVLLNRGKIDCFRVTNDQLPDFIPRTGILLSPIDPYLTVADRDDFNPSALNAVRHNGKIMAWPLWSTALVLIGNPSIMQERGVEPASPDHPWSWEQFVEALRQTTFRRSDGSEVWGLTAPARPPLFEWSPLLWANVGPIFLSRETSEENSGSNLGLASGLGSALQKVSELRELGVLVPSFGIDDQPTAQDQFLSGRAAFILSSPAFIRTLASKKMPYVILPPPMGDFGKPITTGALGCFAVVAHPENPARTQAAHRLARYLTSAEVADDAPGWYLAPPVRRSVKSFENDPDYKGLMEIVRTAVYMNPPGGVGFLETTVIPKFQAVLLGELPPDRAILDIRSAYARKALD